MSINNVIINVHHEFFSLMLLLMFIINFVRSLIHVTKSTWDFIYTHTQTNEHTQAIGGPHHLGSKGIVLSRRLFKVACTLY
jgi:hypothetical protein